MSALITEKRLAELRTAAEVGIRMSEFHPHTVHVRPEELASLVEEVHVLRLEVAEYRAARAELAEASRV